MTDEIEKEEPIAKPHKAITILFMTAFGFSLTIFFPLFFILNPFFFEQSKSISPHLHKFLLEYTDHIVPLTFSCMSGILGVILRYKMIDTDRVATNNLDTISIIGTVMGAISYVIIQSKILIGLAYPKINIEHTDAGFLGIVLFGILFGFFSQELVSYSRIRMFDTVPKNSKEAKS